MSSALVLGVLDGLMIGFLAVGLVLVYKANRFINLAHAQIGTYSALLLAKMVLGGVSWWLAFPVVIVVGIGTSLLVERFVVRPLRKRASSAIVLLLVSIGVAQMLQALPFIPALGPDAQQLTLEGYPLPFQTSFSLGGVVLTGQYMLILVIVPTVVALLGAFLKFSVMGKMIRAAASNPDAARLAGISISRVSMVTWGVAGALSAVTAVLQAPSQPSFDASALGPDALLLALGAAAAGGFTSIPATLLGGLALGLVNQFALYVTHSGGKADLVVLVAIIAILLVRSGVISAAVKLTAEQLPTTRPMRIPVQVADRNYVRHSGRLLGGFGLFLGIVAPLLPVLSSNARHFQLSLILIYALLGVAVTMVVGWAGQISLGHFALVGVGAYLTARLSPQGWSLPMLLLASAALGAAIMVVIGLPALRIRGFTLAITTLGFAVIAPTWLFRQPWFGSERSFALPVTPPGLLGLGRPGDQLTVYYLCLAVLVITLLAVQGLRRSLAGRMVLAVRDNEAAAMSFGMTPATVKLAVLAVSGGIGGMAGVLWADVWQSLAADQFNPALSLSILAIPVIGGLGSLSGAVVASVLLYGMTFFLGPHLEFIFGSVANQIGFQLVLGGLGLVMVLLQYPTGLAGLAQNKWEQFLDNVARQQPDPLAATDLPNALVTTDLQLAFGGVHALDHVSVVVRPGEIVGLIGPNGAGKSTLMNAVTGALPATGTVQLFGTDVTGMQPDLRWLHGLGRTFQDARLFPSLTVSDVIALAVRDENRPGVLAALLRLPWVPFAGRQTRAQADDIIDRFGLRPWANALISDLSTGTRRICDLAAQVAARPQLLLLDEPTAGVAQREAEAFPPLLRRIRDELGCAILIVEHDLPLLMRLCDRIYAMESGQVIAEGTPEHVRNNPRVVASYLGTNETAVKRSGRTTTPPKPRTPRTRQKVTVGAGPEDDG